MCLSSMLHDIDRSAFEPGRYVTTSLGPCGRRKFEVISAGRDTVLVKDSKSGSRYRLPLEHVAVVDLGDERDHVDNYLNDNKGSSNMTTTSKIANAVSQPAPKQDTGGPDSNANLVRKRIKILQAANPYVMEEEVEPEEDLLCRRRRDIVDYMSDWRE